MRQVKFYFVLLLSLCMLQVHGKTTALKEIENPSNVLLLQAGDNGEVTLNNPLEFYDNGGADDKYSKPFDGQVTFVPSSADKVVKLTFNEFKTYYSHYFYVYSGKEADNSKLIGKYYSTTFPASIISNAEDGCLTVRFVATSSGYTYLGWNILAESYEPAPLSVKSVTCDNEAAEKTMRGCSDALIAKIAVNVEGDNGSLAINSVKGNFTSSTNAADVVNSKLWYSSDNETFAPINQVGETSTSTECVFTPASQLNITAPGTYYLYVTASVNSEAAEGNTIAFNLNDISINNNSYSSESFVAATTTVKAGFKGNYTIGVSQDADYATIGAAVDALKDGVEGAVTFSIEPGSYAENILIKDIAGASETAPITFTSTTGNRNDVIITGNGYSEPAYGETKYGMAAVENTPYVTFSNISFVPSSQSFPYCVSVFNKSRHFTMSGCALTADIVTSGYSGMNMVYLKAVDKEGCNNDYATVDGNYITGGYIAVYGQGTGYTSLTKQVGLTVTNNVITNACGKGIYVPDGNYTTIDGNTIISNTTQKTDYNAMDIYNNKYLVSVSNNKIYNNQEIYSSGIYFRTGTSGTEDAPALVYNNVVAFTNSPSTSSYALKVNSDCYNIKVVYNSFSINGTAGYPVGITTNKTDLKNIVFVNNLVQNFTESPAIYVYAASQLSALTFDKNAYYTAGEKFASLGGDTFDDWKTSANDNSSLLEKANFVAAGDLHLISAGNLCQAAPLAQFTTDLDGVTRDAKTPTIGAYEYKPYVAVVPEMCENYPATGNVTHNSIEIKTKWNVGGSLYAKIVKSGETAPTADALAEEKAVQIIADSEVSSKFANLDDDTNYTAYFMLQSATGEKSVVYASNSIATPKYYAPLAVLLDDDIDAIDAGTEVELESAVSGGGEPYSYSWTDKSNVVVGNGETLKVSPTLPQEYTLTVTSADGQKASAYVQVPVYGTKEIASFEDNYLEPESFWCGKDVEDEYEFSFFSGSYKFTNSYMPAYSFWGGFAYSNVSATLFDPDQFGTHQFRNVVGTGVAGSQTYGVAYTMGSETEIEVYSSRDGEIVPGVFLTNNAYTLNSIMNGDSFAQPFKQGDYFKVIFTGDNDNTVEYYLADYRDEDESKHYAVKDWRWCNLSSLGNVKTITVSTEGSNVYIPAYLCLDNFGGDLTTDAPVSKTAAEFNIFPVPAQSELNITGITGNYNYRIFNVNGTVCAQGKACDNAQIQVEQLTAGSYILEVSGDNINRTVKNFIKK